LRIWFVFQNLLGSIEEHVGDEWKGILSYVQKAIPASGPVALALASGDWTSITKKIKEEGGDQLKELEATAKKLMDKAQEINKDKKGNLEDFVKQLKEGQYFPLSLASSLQKHSDWMLLSSSGCS
jgi:hypothetical protein